MNKRISEMDLVSSLLGTEMIEVVQNGLNYRCTPQQIANLAGGISVSTIDTSGGTITLDYNGQQQRMFKSTSQITGNKTVEFDNETGALELKSWKFSVDTEGRKIIFPANVVFVPGTVGWESEDADTLTIPAGGKYEITGTFDSTANEWLLKLYGNY